ncbi:hypothetical protein DFH09DRAFT_1327562 [Mycena vulgaris]|nr:hypothetical protein DFH09DRAFT_1327562 [Mycena vulgaris]
MIAIPTTKLATKPLDLHLNLYVESHVLTCAVNTGISLSSADTSLIVAFGDSWTANGSPDGSKANAPIYNPSDGFLIENGTFRITNGYTWIEWVSMDSKIPLRDYAVPGALTDRSMYPAKSQSSDFIQQADLFISQNIKIDVDRTVFSIYFGINDWVNGGDLRNMAIPRLLAKVKRKLIASPVGARKFLFIGLPQWTDLDNNNFVEQIYEFRDQVAAEGISIDFAYVNLVRLYAHVKANLETYGFTERGPCVTRAGGTCTHPDLHTTFLSTHPSGKLHQIIAQYVRETVASCTNYPRQREPNCPGNTFNRTVAYVDISAQHRDCNPYPDLSQLPLQDYDFVIITQFRIQADGSLEAPDVGGTSGFVSDMEALWKGKVKILFGLVVDDWPSLYKNVDAFIDGFDFLILNPDASIAGSRTDPPAGFGKFIRAVRAGMKVDPYISISVSGHTIRTDWEEFLPVIHFVNVLAIDFVLPGESKIFQPHSSIRDIKWFTQTNGYDIMHKFNLIQAYMGRTWELDGPCVGYGCTTTGAGITDHEQTNSCAIDGELPYTSIMFYKAQYQAEEHTDGFSWTKYMILRDQGAISYDDSDTRRRKQNWAEKACYGGRGIWGVDDAVPMEGQHSGTSDVLVQSADLNRRADAHWANWKYTGLCHDYGREIATSQLMDISGSWDKACHSTPAVDIHGNNVYAQKCENQYFAKLNGISSGEWADFCASTPNTVNGVHFDRPTSCYNGWTGEFGYFRVDDETCAGEWSNLVDLGCVASENIGFKRFQATVTGFTGSAATVCNVRSYSLYGNYFEHPTLCTLSSTSATGTFDVQATECGIPPCPDGMVWDYAINGNSKNQGCRTCDDGPGYTPPGLDHASVVGGILGFNAKLNTTVPSHSTTSAKRAGCDAPGFHLPAPRISRLPVVNRFLDEGPTVEDIVNRESVRLRFESAWYSSFFRNGTAREVGGWIYRHPDQDNNVVAIVDADPGRAGTPFPQLGNTHGNPAIDLTQPLSMPRDGDAPAGYILVANWHTHPLGPSQQGNPEPSRADHENAWRRDVPGIPRRDICMTRENGIRSGPRHYPNTGTWNGQESARRIGSWRPSHAPNQLE